MLAELSNEIALRWVPLDLTYDKSTLVQVLAWCHQAISHTWANVDPDLCHQMASLGLNELKKMGSLRHPQWYDLSKSSLLSDYKKIFIQLRNYFSIGKLSWDLVIQCKSVKTYSKIGYQWMKSTDTLFCMSYNNHQMTGYQCNNSRRSLPCWVTINHNQIFILPTGVPNIKLYFKSDWIIKV